MQTKIRRITVTTSTIEKELLGLERQYWQAVKDQDAAAAMRLTAEPCIITGASGVQKVTRDQMGQMMKQANTYSIKNYKLDDNVIVSMRGEDTAILAYKVREDLVVEGKPVSFEAADASVWQRQRGNWVCALHTESILGDPFGRDRRS